MVPKRIVLLLALALLAIGLAACELSASTPPPASPTPDSAMSTLQAELGNIATQTAAAGGGVPVGTPVVPAGTDQAPPAGGTPGAGTPGTEPQTPDTGTPEATEAPVEEPEEPQEEPQEPEEEDVDFEFEEPPLPNNYTIQKGEFPFCIARRFDLDVSELLSLNGLGANSLVSVGFTLKIPQTGNGFSGQRSLRDRPDTFTVSSGDTINSIACLYGDVFPEAIAQRNNLSKPYNLRAGQELRIP
jgi:LysM repeat protein